MKTITCPSCKGKGHVYNALIGLFPIYGWIFSVFETNNPDGVTREECGQCDGNGYIERPD